MKIKVGFKGRHLSYWLLLRNGRFKLVRLKEKEKDEKIYSLMK